MGKQIIHFFQRADLAEPHLGAFGAQRVQLTPQRSIAIDRSYWAYGTPIWLDTEAPLGDEGSMKRFRQLLVAQDTGSAIRGRLVVTCTGASETARVELPDP